MSTTEHEFALGLSTLMYDLSDKHQAVAVIIVFKSSLVKTDSISCVFRPTLKPMKDAGLCIWVFLYSHDITTQLFVQVCKSVNEGYCFQAGSIIIMF